MARGNQAGRNVWETAKLAMAASVVVLALGNAARAEYPPPLIFGHIVSAAADDLPSILAASAPLFDAAKAGKTGEWSNQETGNSGTVTLRRIFALKDIPCRTFDYATWTEHHSNETRVVVDWCKLTDNGWKLVDPREPAPGPSGQ